MDPISGMHMAAMEAINADNITPIDVPEWCRVLNAEKEWPSLEYRKAIAYACKLYESGIHPEKLPKEADGCFSKRPGLDEGSHSTYYYVIAELNQYDFGRGGGDGPSSHAIFMQALKAVRMDQASVDKLKRMVLDKFPGYSIWCERDEQTRLCIGDKCPYTYYGREISNGKEKPGPGTPIALPDWVKRSGNLPTDNLRKAANYLVGKLKPKVEAIKKTEAFKKEFVTIDFPGGFNSNGHQYTFTAVKVYCDQFPFMHAYCAKYNLPTTGNYQWPKERVSSFPKEFLEACKPAFDALGVDTFIKAEKANIEKMYPDYELVSKDEDDDWDGRYVELTIKPKKMYK